MCIPTGTKAIAAPIVAPAPTRDGVTAAAMKDPVSLVNESKNIIAKRQGIFGNIRTTPLGDASYGTSAVARFGRAA